MDAVEAAAVLRQVAAWIEHQQFSRRLTNAELYMMGIGGSYDAARAERARAAWARKKAREKWPTVKQVRSRST